MLPRCLWVCRRIRSGGGRDRAEGGYQMIHSTIVREVVRCLSGHSERNRARDRSASLCKRPESCGRKLGCMDLQVVATKHVGLGRPNIQYPVGFSDSTYNAREGSPTLSRFSNTELQETETIRMRMHRAACISASPAPRRIHDRQAATVSIYTAHRLHVVQSEMRDRPMFQGGRRFQGCGLLREFHRGFARVDRLKS